MSEPKIPADLAKYFDALLVIETVDDAKELIANPDVIENLELHEANSEATLEVEGDES